MKASELRNLRDLISQSIAIAEKAHAAAKGSAAQTALAFALMQLESSLSAVEKEIRDGGK
jgi:hypothetical protein